jgi:hypothetical protein
VVVVNRRMQWNKEVEVDTLECYSPEQNEAVFLVVVFE